MSFSFKESIKIETLKILVEIEEDEKYELLVRRVYSSVKYECKKLQK